MSVDVDAVAPHEILSGAKIRHLRERQILTRSDTAYKSGVDYRLLRAIEEGTVRPLPHHTFRLAWLYEVAPNEIDSRLTSKPTGPIDAPILLDERRKIGPRINRHMVRLDRELEWLRVGLGFANWRHGPRRWFEGYTDCPPSWVKAYDAAYLLEIRPSLLSKLLTDVMPPPYVPRLHFGPSEPIGYRIHRARLARGRTLPGLARQAGLTDAQQRAVEECKLQPTPVQLEAYDEALRIPGLLTPVKEPSYGR